MACSLLREFAVYLICRRRWHERNGLCRLVSSRPILHSCYRTDTDANFDRFMEIVYLSILTVGQANHQIQYQERRSLRVCLTVERRSLVPSYYDYVRKGSRMISMKKNKTLQEHNFTSGIQFWKNLSNQSITHWGFAHVTAILRPSRRAWTGIYSSCITRGSEALRSACGIK